MVKENIQRTFSIVDALDERVKIIQEDIIKCNEDISEIKKYNSVVSAQKILLGILVFICGLAGFCFAGFAILLISEIGFYAIGDFFGLMIPLVICIILALFLSRKYQALSLDTESLDKLNDQRLTLNVDLQNANDEKREIVIRYDRELKMEQNNDIIGENETFENDLKECPMCAETVKQKAKLCRYCGYKFEG